MTSDIHTILGHPHIRPRRLRTTQSIRDLVQENHINKTDLIYPIFVSDHNSTKTEVLNLPNVYRWPFDDALKEIQEAYALGIRAVMLFPVIDTKYKCADGAYAHDKDGLLQRFIKKAKNNCPNMLLFSDVALDPYTTHGHDGIIDDTGYVKNDETVDSLCQQALSLAQAGIDFVCPSDMMDGRIGAIRHTLDLHAFSNVGIVSYSVKYASAFYGPFREALNNQHLIGLDKKTYQMNPANSQEALREASLDIEEGADILIVKPGTLYLDVISKVKNISPVPVAAYHVSGEYAMLKLASQQGVLDEKKAVHETLLAFKRAGADLIITYYAKWICEII